MGVIGAELEQLQALQANFDRQSRAIEELRASIRGDLANTWWKGPAAERFRGSWSGEFEPALRKLQAALQEAATELARRRAALLEAGS